MKKGTVMALTTSVLLISGCTGKQYPPSEVLFEGTYRLEDAENMSFTFGADSTLTVSQNGIYELEEREDGETVLRICLDDTIRELPEDYNFTEYLVHREDDHLILTFTTEEFNLDANPMLLFPLKGKDGLLHGEYFDGTYQIGEDGDSYQYIFGEDGSVALQVEEYYYADGEGRMTLRDHAGSTRYQYESSEDTLLIKNRKGETVLDLYKRTEPDEK